MNHFMLKDALEKQKDCNDDYSMIFETIQLMVKFAAMNRKNGRQALEYIVATMYEDTVRGGKFPASNYYQYKLKPLDRMLYKMIMSIVNGEDTDKTAFVGMTCYEISNFSGLDALAACIIYRACISFHKDPAVTPHALEKDLMSLLEPEVEDLYIEYIRDKKRQ